MHDAGICSVDYHFSVFNNNPAWIKEAGDLGMIVNVWTVNNADDMADFIERGADYITTDDPALLSGIHRLD